MAVTSRTSPRASTASVRISGARPAPVGNAVAKRFLALLGPPRIGERQGKVEVQADDTFKRVPRSSRCLDASMAMKIENVQRHVRLLANYPAVVRLGRYLEDCAGQQVEVDTVLVLYGSMSRQNSARMRGVA